MLEFFTLQLGYIHQLCEPILTQLSPPTPSTFYILKTCSCRPGFLSMGRNDESIIFYGSN